MSRITKRQYVSKVRSRRADATRTRVLNAAKKLFMRHGIDRATMAEIADKAKVAVPTVYALYKSKEGILRALMESALFGPRFQEARAKLDGVADPVNLIALSAHVARAIYETESAELGLIRGSSAFSPALRNLEREFEAIRFEMQQERVRSLFAHGKHRKGLTLKEARRILWMFTSRDIYRMLVHEGGWTPDQYQQWLSGAILSALVDVNASGIRDVQVVPSARN
jgi:AcrR family transcriptional regulator